MNSTQEKNIIVKFDYDMAKENGMSDNAYNPIMYIIVNNDINMNNNKLIKHCCHIVSQIVRDNESLQQKSETYLSWVCNFEQTEILKANEETLLYFINEFSDKTKEVWCDHVMDIDRTDTSPISITAVAFTPIPIGQTPEIIKSLKTI